MYKVSVVIPVYKAEKYIEKCSRSLFGQSLDDIEYLFIDDCSPDNSIQIVKDVLKEYPSRNNAVVFHKMEYNSGQAIVREWGIRNAKGKYIIHCDSDDWIKPTMLEQMYNMAVNNDYDIVLCKYEITNGYKSWLDPSFTKPIINTKIGLITQLLNWEISGSLCTKLVKRSIYNDNIIYPKDSMCEDITLSIQLILQANYFGIIDEPLYCYYTNPESTCRAQNSISSKRNALQRINNSKIIEYSLKKNFHIGNFNHDMLRLKSRILATGRSLPLKLYLNAYPLDNISLLNIFKLPFRNVLGHFLKIIGLYDLIKRNA